MVDRKLIRDWQKVLTARVVLLKEKAKSMKIIAEAVKIQNKYKIHGASFIAHTAKNQYNNNSNIKRSVFHSRLANF